MWQRRSSSQQSFVVVRLLQIYATAVDARSPAASSRLLHCEAPLRFAAGDNNSSSSSSCVSVASLADADSIVADDDGNEFFYDDEFGSLLSPSRCIAAAEETAPANDRSSISDETDSLLNVNGNEFVVDDRTFSTSQSDAGSQISSSSSSSSINNNNNSNRCDCDYDNVWQSPVENVAYRSTEVVDDRRKRPLAATGELKSSKVPPAWSHVNTSTADVRTSGSGSLYPVYRQDERCSERSNDEIFRKIPTRSPRIAAGRENRTQVGTRCGTRGETSGDSGVGEAPQRSVTTWGKLGNSRKRIDNSSVSSTSWQFRKTTTDGPPANHPTLGSDDTWLRDCAVALQAKGSRSNTREVDVKTSSSFQNRSGPTSAVRPKPGLLLDRYAKLHRTAVDANATNSTPRSKYLPSSNPGTSNSGDDGQAVGRSAVSRNNNDFAYTTSAGAKPADNLLMMLSDAFDRSSSSASCQSEEGGQRIANGNRNACTDKCNHKTVRSTSDIRCCRNEADDLGSESSLSLTPVEHRVATMTIGSNEDCQLGDSGCCSGKTSMAAPEAVSLLIPSPASLVSAVSSGQSSCSYELPPWRLPDVRFIDERVMRPLHSSSDSSNGSGSSSSSICDDVHAYYQSKLLVTGDDDGIHFDEQEDGDYYIDSESESDCFVGHIAIESIHSPHSSGSNSASSPGIVDDELFFLAASRQVELDAARVLHQLPQPQRGVSDLAADDRCAAVNFSGFADFLPETERNNAAGGSTANRPNCCSPPPGGRPVKARRPSSLLHDGSFTTKCRRFVLLSDGNDELLSAGVNRSREFHSVNFEESRLHASSHASDAAAAAAAAAGASSQLHESAFTAINERRHVGRMQPLRSTAYEGGSGERYNVVDSAS
jgi:hypothetical protein